jgi:hypothetical protein
VVVVGPPVGPPLGRDGDDAGPRVVDGGNFAVFFFVFFSSSLDSCSSLSSADEEFVKVLPQKSVLATTPEWRPYKGVTSTTSSSSEDQS